MLQTSLSMVCYWRCHGVLRGEAYGEDKYLYNRPGPDVVKKLQAEHSHREVQYEN